MATPAATLAVLVSAAGIKQTNAGLASVQGNLVSTGAAGTQMGSRIATGAKYGTAAVLGMAAWSVKSAAQFESAFAEVRKTVDTNEQGFARLERGIRGMAKEIPTTADELSRIAGSAGALGIKSKAILPFTRTIADLGETTNLSGDQAADALARIANIMGTSQKDYRRMGSTIVRLGNSLAATESEITEMSLGIAGAGKIVGLTESQVFSFAGALASVGVEAEAGGSSISRAFIGMADSVQSGNAKLAVFSKVAGLSSEEFAKAFEGNAASAMVTFIEGLARMRKEGGNVFGVLDRLGLSEIRVRKALLNASGAGDLFRRALKEGSAEWQRNTALTNEANKRYKTTEAQFEILKNKARDYAITIGNELLPEVNELMRVLGDDKLSADEKFERVAKVLEGVFADAVNAAADAGPKIAGALASGFARSWADMSPLAKLFTAAAIIRLVGGKGALTATGMTIGRALGGGIAAGTVTTAAGGAAGAGAAGGLIGGMRGKLLPVAKRAGLAGVGIALADGVIGEFGRRSQARSSDMLEALKAQSGPKLLGKDFFGSLDKLHEGLGLHEDERVARRLLPVFEQLKAGRTLLSQAEVNDLASVAHKLDLTKQQRVQVERTISLLQQSRNLRFGVDLEMDPAKLRILDSNLQRLKAGVFTTTGDIAKVSRRNMAIVATQLGKGTAEGRKAASQNLTATARAFQLNMLRSGNVTKAGMARVERLIREANIVNPTRVQARGFGREWARGMDTSKEVTKRSVREMIREAGRMPAPMRKVALQTWNDQIAQARRGGKITKAEAADMRSKLLAAFQGIELSSKRKSKAGADAVIANTARMVNTTGRGFDVFAGNANSALRGFGAKELKFEIRKFAPQGKQRGGPINMGAPSGDTVPAMLERGEYVLNRKAVQHVGKGNLDRINFGAAPRFQVGGGVGYPGVSGDTDFVPALGFALSKMARATNHPIFVQDGRRTMAEQAHLYSLYQSGRGNLAAAPTPNAPHIRGIAGDITPGREAFGGIAGQFGLGFTVPSESWHIELLNAAMGALGAAPAAPKLARLMMAGSPGMLRDLGQASLDEVHKAGQRYLRQQTTFDGMGGGPWRGVLQRIAGARGWNAGDWMELVMRESGGDPTAVNPSSGAAGLAQALPASKYPPGAWPYAGPESGAKQIQWMASYISGRYGSPTAALGFHDANNWYQEGGPIGLQPGGHIGKEIKKVAEFVRRQPKQKKRNKAVNALLGNIRKIGVPTEKLAEMSAGAARAGDAADRAGQLTRDLYTPDGEQILLKSLGKDDPLRLAFLAQYGAADGDEDRPVQEFGRVAGGTELEWVRERMARLLAWRNEILRVQEIVTQRKERVAKLIEQTKGQIRNIADEMRKAAQRRAKLQRQVNGREREIEKLEKQIDRWKDKPKKNAAAIKDARERVKSLRGENKATNEEIRGIESKQAARKRTKEMLSGRVLKTLGNRRQLLVTAGGDMASDLETVQGPVTNMRQLKTLPPTGVLSGEIFAAQIRERDLTIRPAKIVDSSASSSEPVDHSRNLDRELFNARYGQEALQALLANIQSGATRLRDTGFAGMFATGGYVPGGRWGVAGETGQAEVVRGPATVYSPVTSRGMLGGQPIVMNPEFDVHVYVGDREITDIVEVVVDRRDRRGALTARAGVRP